MKKYKEFVNESSAPNTVDLKDFYTAYNNLNMYASNIKDKEIVNSTDFSKYVESLDVLISIILDLGELTRAIYKLVEPTKLMEPYYIAKEKVIRKSTLKTRDITRLIKNIMNLRKHLKSIK